MAGSTTQGLTPATFPGALQIGSAWALAVIFVIECSGGALADSRSTCQAAGGTYLSGVVISPPEFRHGHHLRGVELSHTHVMLQSDQDHQTYDIAMDDVFAAGYDRAENLVPSPLTRIRQNDHLDLCGRLYSDGIGLDWVHTNCGRRPTRNHPDGWVKIVAPDGTRTENLEGSTEYCGLWSRESP